ncbi:MAG: DedA family protein [Patescibacteria group bacterium]
MSKRGKKVELIKEIETLYLSWGYLIVFLGSFIEITPMGWTIPGGLILAAGGFYAYGGNLSLSLVLLAGALGAWLTFITAYVLGNKSGAYFIRLLKQEKNAARAKTLLARHGPVILTTSLLANLTRFWVAYISGSQNYNFLRFLFYAGVASLAWSSLWIVVGYLAGIERENLEKLATGLGALTWVLLFLALGVIYLKIKKEFRQFKGSRNENPGN